MRCGGGAACDAVAEATHEVTLARMWESAEAMPSLPEIEEPRLWVARTDYFDDIRIGGPILEHVRILFMRIRNTLRFLLGNVAATALGIGPCIASRDRTEGAARSAATGTGAPLHTWQTMLTFPVAPRLLPG